MTDRRKPIAFNTTLRNPARIAQFVSIIDKYQNQKLTHELIFKIEADFIKEKIYLPTKGILGTYKDSDPKYNYQAEDQSQNAYQKVAALFDKWKNNETLTIEDIEYLLKNTLTKHKEKGYEYGWESRFATQISFINELGFIYVEKNKKICISDNGKLLIKNYKNGHKKPGTSDDYENSAFLIAFAKYQTNNPWRKNTIKVNFLYLFLKTIDCLNNKYKSKGINRKELSFFIVWPNNDYSKLAAYINCFRKSVKNASPENIYEYSMNVLEKGINSPLSKASEKFLKEKKKDYKISKITSETPDDVMRKLRLTQLVSLVGNGYYLNINHFEQAKINEIINKYNVNQNFENISLDKYFQYMGSIDDKLKFHSDKISNKRKKEIKDVKLKVLHKWANEKSWNELKEEIAIAVLNNNSKESKDLILKEINKPTRLEFLSSIIMQKALKNVEVVPHYKVDDQGIPYNTASGGNTKEIGTDIDVYQNDTHVLLEPTVSSGQSFQTEHEIPSIMHHIIKTISEEKQNNHVHSDHFAIFLAGKISSYVGTVINGFHNAIEKEYQIDAKIFPWTVDDYVEFSKKVKSLKDYAQLNIYKN